MSGLDNAMTSGLPDFRSFSAIQGADDTGEYRVVLVDSSGRMVAVMQGVYEGALSTIALDSAGRMKAIIVDASDPWASETTVGLEELASRLGSNQIYDRRGHIIRATGFEHGYGGAEVTEASGTRTHAISGARPLFGNYSLKIVFDDASLAIIDVELLVNPRLSSKVGIECSLILPNSGETVQWEFTQDDGTTFEMARVLFTPASGNLDYINDTGGSTSLDTGIMVLNDDWVYTTAKLVVDTEAQEYVRFLIEGEEYDMTGVSYYTRATYGVRALRAGMTVGFTGGSACTVYLDNLILTDQEPPT